MSTGAMPVQALNFSDDGGEMCRISGVCPSILLGWAVSSGSCCCVGAPALPPVPARPVGHGLQSKALGENPHWVE